MISGTDAVGKSQAHSESVVVEVDPGEGGHTLLRVADR